MTLREQTPATDMTCAVTYRATSQAGEEAEIQLYLDADAATLADAWSRLTARYGQVDPETIEIQLRELPLPPSQPNTVAQLYA